MSDQKKSQNRGTTRHALSMARLQSMLRRVEQDLEQNDRESDPSKKLGPEQKQKLYSTAKGLMAMLSSLDRNRAMLKAAELKAKKRPFSNFNLA